MYADNLIPCIILPTRGTDHSSNLIDNIFTNSKKIIYSSELLSDITYYFPIIAAIGTGKRKTTPTVNKAQTVTYAINYWNIKKLNANLFNTNWSLTETDENLNSAYNFFFTILQNKINLHLSYAKHSANKQNKQLWITNALYKSRNHKNYLYRQLLKDTVCKDENKKYRNVLTVSIKRQEHDY